MTRRTPTNRRQFIATAAATTATVGSGLLSLAGGASAQSFAFQPNQRYPDPALQVLDPAFLKYRIYSSTLEQVGTGMRWAEGPVYFPGENGAPGHVLVSDIPNNRIMKFDEKTGAFTVFRNPANYANGNTRDRQGRLVSCEHSVTRRITRTEHDGRIAVLADRFEGKRLNAPNDIVVKSDDSIWFTDPLFGINGEWEGSRAKPEQATTNVYRLDPASGQLTAVITDIVNPNGLAFSPDEKKLYVVEWKGTPNRSIWAYDVAADGRSLSNKTKLIDAADQGALDGFRVDRDGNLWCGWGSNGAIAAEAVEQGGRKVYPLRGQPEALDGVMVFSPAGKPLAHIRLPERCANLCWGGPKNNRLYMASCHSLYAMYFEAHGAT
ncbi:SMP-30/gluconolactonase/LRE family protein [Ideonella sp. DXS22W]|uniref:SMP-30/gluconolactonase/LRE family protein n=1 Tax=Pseudaquabacterium inlustre TaxID=2984192 RepID=A0ABU9CBI5_9BURK